MLVRFGDDERTMATTIACNANSLGIAAAYIFCPLIVTQVNQVPYLLQTIAIISFGMVGLNEFIICFYWNHLLLINSLQAFCIAIRYFRRCASPCCLRIVHRCRRPIRRWFERWKLSDRQLPGARCNTISNIRARFDAKSRCLAFKHRLPWKILVVHLLASLKLWVSRSASRLLLPVRVVLRKPLNHPLQRLQDRKALAHRLGFARLNNNLTNCRVNLRTVCDQLLRAVRRDAFALITRLPTFDPSHHLLRL
jgi:hypothetical protein